MRVTVSASKERNKRQNAQVASVYLPLWTQITQWLVRWASD
jgi:hypothetical protein